MSIILVVFQLRYLTRDLDRSVWALLVWVFKDWTWSSPVYLESGAEWSTYTCR
ncbi:unnamed protein product [Penicillium camemberti]|uniref:Str. FM013 n=1 Tax=Penicillium camemberti (strain FM 013) TaxID=1429867 RepID=A0A0G4PK60_PENC3|nr:unnamed protein product [Penicillium camemberti]